MSFFVFLRTKGARTTTPRNSNAVRRASSVHPTTVVAMVNSAPITAGELQEEVDRLLPPNAAHGHTDEQQKAQFRNNALEELVVRELAYQKAKALQLRPDPAELNAVIMKIRGRYKTGKSFQEALRTEEITEQEFTRRIEKDLLLRKIHKLEIDDKAAVSDAEVKDYYENNVPKYLRPESVRLWEITVKNNPKDAAAAKKKIKEAFQKLKAGQAFDVVAYKFSDDDYRVMGGDYGTVHRGQLGAELEKLAFTAKLKAIAGPFQTSFGWQILRVENHEPERQLKFEEVKDKIAANLRQKRLGQRKVDFVRELKSAAKIQYLAPV